MNYGLANQTIAAQMTAGYATDSAKREAEIPGAMQRLDSRISELQDAIHALENRLTGSVARSSPPAAVGAGQQIKQCMQTGFGTHLDSMNERVVASYQQLRDLIDRLEV